MNMLGLALVHPNILGLALLAFDWAAEKGASLAGAASPSAFSSGAGFATREENKSPSPAFLAAAVFFSPAKIAPVGVGVVPLVLVLKRVSLLISIVLLTSA